MKYFIIGAQNLIIGCLCLLSACRPLHWAEKKIYQGEEVAPFYQDVQQDYLRSARVYDQFTTLLFIDVLWLSSAVRTWYVEQFIIKHGKNETAKALMLRKQLAENHHFISFYVSSYVPNDDTMVWSDKNELWAMRLIVGNREMEPVSVKTVTLPPEYQIIFQNAFNAHRTVYLIQFNARDENDVPLLQPGIGSFMIRCATSFRFVTFTWNCYEDCHSN